MAGGELKSRYRSLSSLAPIPRAPPDKDLAERVNQTYDRWRPWQSKYFDRKTMDATVIRALVEYNTRFAGVCDHGDVSALSLFNGNLSTSKLEVNVMDTALRQIDDDPSDSPQANIIFVRGKREYLRGSNLLALRVHDHFWEKILSSGHVLPSFLEVLHTNDSATMAHLSYIRDRLPEHVSEKLAVEAFHIGLKVGAWRDCEFGLYVREDFQTDKVFALFVGQFDTGNRQAFSEMSKLATRFGGFSSLNLFEVILAFVEEIARVFNIQRWDLEYRFQDIRDKTLDKGGDPNHLGTSSDAFFRASAADPSWRVLVMQPRVLIWAASQFVNEIEFILEQLERYRNLLCRIPPSDYLQLRDAFLRQLSIINGHLATFERLSSRFQFQFDANRAVTAEDDTRILKADSKAMRAIAFVTLLFLPGTFLATFFSMVFFHVGNEQSARLTVDKDIWIYFVVTLPVSLVIFTLAAKYTDLSLSTALEHLIHGIRRCGLRRLLPERKKRDPVDFDLDDPGYKPLQMRWPGQPHLNSG